MIRRDRKPGLVLALLLCLLALRQPLRRRRPALAPAALEARRLEHDEGPLPENRQVPERDLLVVAPGLVDPLPAGPAVRPLSGAAHDDDQLPFAVGATGLPRLARTADAAGIREI